MMSPSFKPVIAATLAPITASRRSTTKGRPPGSGVYFFPRSYSKSVKISSVVPTMRKPW